jgi:hypothetical protein
MRRYDRRYGVLVRGTMLSGALSCGPDSEGGDHELHDLPPITWKGSYIEFGSDMDAEVCPATLPSMNEYMEGVNEHVRSNTIYPIRYYHLREEWAHYGWGCEDADGCVRFEDGAMIVGSRLLSHKHELIHASSIGGEDRLLEEGLAMFLGTDLKWAGIAEPLDIRAALESIEGTTGGLPAEFYPVAGHFVSHLVEEFGLPNVVSLIQASALGMTLDELDALSLEHLGQDLRSAINDYEASGPGCEVAQYSPTWFQCELTPPSIPIFACTASNQAVQVDVELSCANDASGVQDGMIWRDVLIDAPSSIPTLIRLYEGHPVDFIVRGCGQGCSTPFTRLASETAEEHTINQPFELREGLNLVRIIKPVEAEGRVRFSVNLLCP